MVLKNLKGIYGLTRTADLVHQKNQDAETLLPVPLKHPARRPDGNWKDP